MTTMQKASNTVNSQDEHGRCTKEAYDDPFGGGQVKACKQYVIDSAPET